MFIVKRIVPPLLLIALVVSFGISSGRSFALRTLQKGDRVTDSAITMIDGSTKKFSELAGEKGLLLIFWATWSDRSMELLEYADSDLQKSYGEKGIAVVSLNVEHQTLSSGNLEEIGEKLQGLKITMPSGIDEELTIFNNFGVISVPTSVLIGKDLTVVDAYPGFPSVAREEIPAFINSFLGIEEKEKAEEVQYLLAKKPKNNALLYYNLGKNLYKRYLPLKGEMKHVPRRVISKLDESIKRDPDFFAPYMLKAIIYHKAKKEEEKKVVLEEIEKKGFSAHVELRDIAYMYILLEDVEKASGILKALDKEIPDEPSIVLLHGLLALSGEKPDMEVVHALLKKSASSGREDYPFLEDFIDPETGALTGEEDPKTAVMRISEKVLNISKK